MYIKSFCEATGLSRETVRFYVKLGLLSPKTLSTTSTNRYQMFDEEQVERARVIRLGKSLGFTLNEMGELARAYELTGINSEQKSQLLEKKIFQVDQKLEELKAMRQYLSEKLQWEQAGRDGHAPKLCDTQV